LTLTVRPPVYIPRIETEQWVDLLGTLIHSTISSSSSSSSSGFSKSNPFRILDICSGSGCIPLLLAYHGHGLIHTTGLEVDEKALEVARENIRRNGLEQVSTFEKFDLFDDSEEARVDLRKRLMLNGRSDFDMIVSNPPYVSSSDMKKVETTWHEGKFALQGKLRKGSSNSWKGQEKIQGGGGVDVPEEVIEEDDGYSFYRRIKEVYSAFLTEENGIKELPKLVLEVGATQSQPVQEMYASEGRLEVQKETERRKEIGAPKLEDGDMTGTERSIWVYR
jgi:methylase of polypeptide subunit release factors